MMNSDEKGADGKRLGVLLRLYRTDSGESRDALAERMAATRNGERANQPDGAQVARWENGDEIPPQEFLTDFASEFRLSDAERDAILALGGYAANRMDLAVTLAKDAGRRVAAPKLYAIGVGYSLNALGQNGTWVLMAYAGIAFAIVGGQGILRWRRADRVDAIGELFFITLFFILNVSLFHFAITRMDHFGFYALIPWDGTSYFLLLALVVHLILALAASVIFDILRNRVYGDGGRRIQPFVRALWTSLPPCLFVFFIMMVFINEGGWVFYLITLGVAVAGFTAILAFQDEDVALSEFEAKLSLAASAGAVIMLCAVGAAGTLVAYLSPSPLSIPDHNLLMSWEIDFQRLGYPEDELLERARLGILLISVSANAYLATALGGFLLVAARRQLKRAEARSA